LAEAQNGTKNGEYPTWQGLVDYIRTKIKENEGIYVPDLTPVGRC